MSHPQNNDRWFREQVMIHDDALRRWLRSRFPAITDVDNIVQETMARVWMQHVSSTVTSPRALLYTTAHNLAVDLLRRDSVVQMDSIAEIEDLPVLLEDESPSDIVAHQQELELLTQAIQSLPEKCRQVLTLRKIYGLSHKEIGRQLGISEHTVEAQIGNGMRRCAHFLARKGLV